MNRKFIIVIPLKKNIQIEYARELTIKLNDMLNDPYKAYLECFPTGSLEPIGIGIFKEE